MEPTGPSSSGAGCTARPWWGRLCWPPRLPVPPRWLGRCLTFAFVCFAWIFFRAGSVADAFTLISALPSGWNSLPRLGMKAADLAQLVLGVLLLVRLQYWPAPVRQERRAAGTVFCLTACAALAWLSLLAEGAGNAFIYFQF